MSNILYNKVYDLPNSIIDLASFVYAREYVYEGNWHSNLHTHACAELFYITEGKGSFHIKDKTCPVKTGDILVINAHVPHTEVSDREDFLGYIVLGIRGLETFYDIAMNNNDYVFLQNVQNKDSIYPLIKNILYESERGEENYKLICNTLLKAVILYLLRQTTFTAVSPQSQKFGSNELFAIKKYIEKNHKEIFTLEELAEYGHISKYYLVHAFKEEFGMPPMRYQQYYRINESKKLLSETAMSASQIAQALGFLSASHFTQSFKRWTFTTPSEYRKMSREAE